MDKKALILSRKYTDETVIGLGGLKGAPARIVSIEHSDGRNIVTFEWEGTDGTIQRARMYVEDGTNIYTYQVGTTYHYGDLVIFNSAFYRCSVSEYVAEEIIDTSCFEEIGSPDGNYDLVETGELLPPRFNPQDRKMYYCIQEMCFYLWNGYTWIKQEKKATYSTLGMVKINEETLDIDDEGEVRIKVIDKAKIQSLFN